VAPTMPHPPDTATAFSWTGAAPIAMSIYLENRSQKSENKRSTSVLVNGGAADAMSIHRSKKREWIRNRKAFPLRA